jgi:hypothetical protein
MRFYLGTHMPSWLSQAPDGTPLFVSHTRLRTMNLYDGPSAYYTTWACDSGGYTELQRYGAFRDSPRTYARRVDNYRMMIGNLEWAAAQDRMCEPWIISGGTFDGQHYAGTGKSVPIHQRETTGNYLELKSEAPAVNWVPALQGWKLRDYVAHAEMYRDAGIDLASLPRVGVGSVCRRQSTAEIGEIFTELAGYGLKLHGFGVKKLGLKLYGHHLASADSLAWSDWGRHEKGCAPGHATEANCMRFALNYMRDVTGLYPDEEMRAA